MNIQLRNCLVFCVWLSSAHHIFVPQDTRNWSDFSHFYKRKCSRKQKGKLIFNSRNTFLTAAVFDSSLVKFGRVWLHAFGAKLSCAQLSAVKELCFIVLKTESKVRTLFFTASKFVNLDPQSPPLPLLSSIPFKKLCVWWRYGVNEITLYRSCRSLQ